MRPVVLIERTGEFKTILEPLVQSYGFTAPRDKYFTE